MKVRYKILVILLGFIVLLIVANYFVSSYFINDSYKTLQDEYINKEVKKVNSSINGMITKHKLLLTDWCYWDDTRNYILGNNDSFAKANITSSFFTEQSINYVLIYDSNMNLIFSKGYDFKNLVDLEIPTGFVNTVKDYGSETGIVRIGNDKIIFTAKGISNSDATAKEKGLLVFAYKLTDIEIENLSNTLDLELTMENNYDITKTSTIVDEHKNSTYVEINKKFRNVAGGITISFYIENDIEELGAVSLGKSLLVSFFVIIVLGIVIYLIIMRMIKRLELLTKQISKVEFVEGEKYEVSVSGNDELAILSRTVNGMLDRIMCMNDQLLEHATMDMMTGVLNRRAGINRLEHMLIEANESNENVTIAFIDINDLKLVNDIYGHKKGDEYIKNIVFCIVKNTRETDVVCRLGGDEFLIVFPNCKTADANIVLKRIDKDIREFNETGKYQYMMSISKGIVPYKPIMGVSEFIELADKKMYFDKRKYKKKKDTK